MYKRIFCPPKSQSYFLLGPRGTGKTSFIKSFYKEAPFFDLLEADLYQTFLASPQRLADRIPRDYKGWVVIDEIQKIPNLLDEVHRLIESKKLRFVLTGSNARKLKRQNTNLLAGRALHYRMYPLTVEELGESFDIKQSLQFGHLPQIFSSEDPKKFLESYIQVYLKEEIIQESLVRNLPNFSRFLEAASFSQASPLVISNVARDSHVPRKVIESYFSILRDTLLSYELPVFTNRAKRSLITKTKFYFFDAGVFRTIRPQGVLDSDSELNGAALETLVLQEILAQKELKKWDYNVFYWRTRNHIEVDFILYGKRGFKAIEVKASEKIRETDFKGLLEFKKDYPQSELFFIYTGKREYLEKDIQILNVNQFLKKIKNYI